MTFASACDFVFVFLFGSRLGGAHSTTPGNDHALSLPYVLKKFDRGRAPLYFRDPSARRKIK